jgi:hypothetical protein
MQAKLLHIREINFMPVRNKNCRFSNDCVDQTIRTSPLMLLHETVNEAAETNNVKTTVKEKTTKIFAILY